MRFSRDVDVLRVELKIFAGIGANQVLCGGTNGTIAGTTFSAPGADFAACGVEPGGVILLTIGEQSNAFEIVSVDSATTLTISVVRGDDEAAPVGPGNATGVTWRVPTLAAQARDAAFVLSQFFGLKPGDAGGEYDVEQLVDLGPLRQAEAFGILAAWYAGLAVENSDEQTWRKADHYQRLYDTARRMCRIWLDANDDGIADTIKEGGTVKLVRE